MNTAYLKNINHFFQISQTRNGVKFDPNKDIWKIQDISGSSTFNFNHFNIPPKNKHSLKDTFKWYLENNSIRHAANMYKYFKDLIKYLSYNFEKKISRISDIDLINYREHQGLNHEWYLGALSGFLKHWYKMGDSCLTKEAYGYLQETRFKSNPKGEAVLTMDPVKGPFSDLELESIQTTINNSYAKNEIKTDQYILVWLFMIYGSRPIQLAQLKVKDVISVERENDSYELFINIPRAKNRKIARSEFKKRSVPNAFSRILHSYCQQVRAKARGIFPNADESPLFLRNKDIVYNNENNHELKYHLTTNDLEYRLDRIFNNLDVRSERTGEKLNIFPTRFRRTIGTRAASEGHGTLIIAEILDHTDIQNAKVYVESSPEIIERIDRAVALHLAPLAQAFAGTLLKDKSKAIRANDPDADIINPIVDKTCTPAGKCGSHSFCGQMSPLACYTCSSFQAWTDGPHEAVLEHLINERERLMEVTDYRIASVNDKTIMAVAQVVKECQSYKDENEIEVLVDDIK